MISSGSHWRRASRHRIRLIALSLALQLLPVSVAAQELTPGAYWPLPVRINIVTLVNSMNWGDVTFDPALPTENARGTIDTVAIAYTRTLTLAGRSANVGLQIPLIGGHVEGLYLGVPTERGQLGFGDPRLSLGVNLYGAPAMTPQNHAAYRMRTIVGVSLTVAAPLGQYDDSKLLNLGSNRWAVKPEIGLSRAAGRWIVEVMAGIWLFTDNRDFSGGRTREQDPIASVQGHVTYRFSPRVWLAGDANFYRGGQTTVDGVRHLDIQRNARIGWTFSWALDQHHAFRASVSHGAYTTIGGDFTSVAVGYNYAWTR
jgi:hypothetical protein